MAATLRIDIVTDARGTQTAIAQTESKLGKMGRKAGKAGLLVAGGVAAVGGAAVILGKQAYDAASNVEQSFGALDSIYGKHAGLLKDLASEAANTVGLSKSQYAELASVLGAQLTNMGRSQKKAAGETEGLISLGSDLAATFGGSVADAVNSVSSALKGETDPIERYGVSIKQSDINARLAAQGLDELEGKAAKQAQASAVLALITEQTAKSHGAFAREADTAAGQQARLSANVENLKAKLGEKLLPVMASTFEYINTRVIPGVSVFASDLNEKLGPAVQATGDWVTRKLIPAAKSLYRWFIEEIAPNIRDTLVPIVDGLRGAFEKITGKLDENQDSLSKVGNFLKKVAEFASDLQPIIGVILGGAFEVLGTAIGVVIDVISELVDLIDAAISGAKKLADAITSIPGAGIVGKGIGAIGGLFSSPVLGGVGALAGRAAPVSRVGLGALATAAAGGGYGYAGGGLVGLGQGGPAIVDASRHYNIDATGAIDPIATADRIRAILRADDVRNGRSATYVPANGWAG